VPAPMNRYDMVDLCNDGHDHDRAYNGAHGRL